MNRAEPAPAAAIDNPHPGPRVLVLGGGGFVGRAVMQALAKAGFAPRAGLRRPPAPAEAGWACHCDATDQEAVTRAAQDADYAVNAVLGTPATMVRATQALCEASRRTGLRRILHLSSMSVYGARSGRVSEDAPLLARDRYGAAKIACEAALRRLIAQGGEAVILRPGIVYGPGGEQWVGRIGRMLQAGRLGDLGAAGDGFCNLIYGADLGDAAASALTTPQAAGLAINIASSGELRWNDYLVALGRTLGAVPVARIGATRLTLEARVAAPLLQAFKPARVLPDPITPSLLALFGRELLPDTRLQDAVLGVPATPLGEGLAASAAWLRAQGLPHPRAARRAREVPALHACPRT